MMSYLERPNQRSQVPSGTLRCLTFLFVSSCCLSTSLPGAIAMQVPRKVYTLKSDQGACSTLTSSPRLLQVNPYNPSSSSTHRREVTFSDLFGGLKSFARDKFSSPPYNSAETHVFIYFERTILDFLSNKSKIFNKFFKEKPQASLVPLLEFDRDFSGKEKEFLRILTDLRNPGFQRDFFQKFLLLRPSSWLGFFAQFVPFWGAQIKFQRELLKALASGKGILSSDSNSVQIELLPSSSSPEGVAEEISAANPKYKWLVFLLERARSIGHHVLMKSDSTDYLKKIGNLNEYKDFFPNSIKNKWSAINKLIGENVELFSIFLSHTQYLEILKNFIEDSMKKRLAVTKDCVEFANQWKGPFEYGEELVEIAALALKGNPRDFESILKKKKIVRDAQFLPPDFVHEIVKPFIEDVVQQGAMLVAPDRYEKLIPHFPKAWNLKRGFEDTEARPTA